MSKIVLCSSNPLVRERWRQGVAGFPLWEEQEDLTGLKAALSNAEPGLVLLHGSMRELAGVSGLAVLRAAFPKVRWVWFADVPDELEGISMLKAGAHGYANTYISPTVMARLIEVVEMGEVWVGERLMQRLIAGLAGTSADGVRRAHVLDSLTPREREIALLVAEGENNKRIAARLDVTERTVKAHLTAVFRKTGTRDRLQLALLVNEEVPLVRAGGRGA